MPWLISQLFGGFTFFQGAALLVIAVIVGAGSPPRGVRRVGVIFALLGMLLVAVSATAIPYWMYCVWIAAVFAWIARGCLKNPRSRMVASAALIFASAAAAGMELRFYFLPTLSPASAPRLYVIGDSISAGLAVNRASTWPTILREQHDVQVIDLSRAGATLADGLRGLQIMNLSTGIVIIELGGNDVIGRVNPEQFARDLDSLIRRVQSSSRQTVMFELPLLPFDNAYGIEQRRVAARYQVALIPRRYFADILTAPGDTLDGIHLTSAGQRRMADLVCRVVGPSLKG
jgi:acyl-CoA thioesterase-1